MIFRLLIILCLAFAPAVSHADNRDRVRDYIVRELREDGYRDIRISRTLLGRMRFIATRHDARREIVVNPSTGEILRDYVRFRNSSGSSAGTSGYDSDYDDDDYDDESDDDEGDDESDDDDSDNSGSGSSNSGSGSSGSGGGSDDDDDD